ncbi:MAG: hypothetical protein EXX96DRAFT_548502 [Benjaminiella poitrasii]|nr:MAG: hypothetical protein EXX96DRAFT_548502 [Benjaminiella poitrasii]
MNTMIERIKHKMKQVKLQEEKTVAKEAHRVFDKISNAIYGTSTQHSLVSSHSIPSLSSSLSTSPSSSTCSTASSNFFSDIGNGASNQTPLIKKTVAKHPDHYITPKASAPAKSKTPSHHFLGTPPGNIHTTQPRFNRKQLTMNKPCLVNYSKIAPLKEVEDMLSRLRNENFDLKLRLYHSSFDKSALDEQVSFIRGSACRDNEAMTAMMQEQMETIRKLKQEIRVKTDKLKYYDKRVPQMKELIREKEHQRKALITILQDHHIPIPQH